MDEALATELSSFKAALHKLGFHPKTVKAYVRNLSKFLSENPSVVFADEDKSEKVISEYFSATATSYDAFALHASLRKWHWLRFGRKLGKVRIDHKLFPSSPQIDEEVVRLRSRIESDGLAKSVVKECCSTVEMFLKWRFPDGEVDASSIRDSDALDYLAEVKSHLSPGAAKAEVNKLSHYLRLLSEEDPDRAVGLPIAPACWGAGSLPRMMGDDELASILAVETCPEVGSRNRAALLLMANMGLRCCETVALTLDDIDFRNGAIRVAAIKGNSERRLPLERATGEALAAYIANHRPDSDFRAVFLRNKARRGDPLTRSQMRNSLRYQARLAGISDFGTHMLRRRAATSMVERGVPLKIVADVLGHAEVQTSNAYLRIDVKTLRTVAADWPGDLRG